MNYWQTTRFQIDLTAPQIMGIVNVTPDSFSDGGHYSGSLKSALEHAESLLRDGADILDIGGESTRPNAAFVSIDEEWQRVAPVLQEVATWNIPISLDTRRAEIMARALDAGWADIINDVQGLEDKGAVELLAQQQNTGICLMHMQGLPENMQDSPDYGNVVGEVARYLQARADVCLAHNIARERITLDPGFGFGKTLAHNIALMQNLSELHSSHDLPLFIGVSRKRMIGELLQRDEPTERVSGSVAAALFAAEQGAKIIRVHDVKETVDAFQVWSALKWV
ncbi:dihydropteroate synthase [Neisseriaceae bacterium B1]